MTQPEAIALSVFGAFCWVGLVVSLVVSLYWARYR